MDPMLSMQKPFSYLRCLSLWKPPTHSWGYDLITSGFMRFSNEQLDDQAIRERLWPRLDQIHFPVWLRSDVPDEYEWGQKASWKYFLEGTMERTLTFLREVFLKFHIVYLMGCVAVASYFMIARRSPSEALNSITKPIFRLSTMHSIALMTIFFTWYHIRSSSWGRAVLKGKALMRPFPAVSLTKAEELPLVSDGPTTFPANNDVLFGTRFDAKFLGKYEKYLDWHKGNKPYIRAIRTYAPFYESYQRLPPTFDEQLLASVIESVERTKGRFLQQDYRNGAWRVMSEDEIESHIRRDLAFGAYGVKRALRQTLRRMIALGRFGFGREWALMRKGVVYLHLLENRLAEKRVSDVEKEKPQRVQISPITSILEQLPSSKASTTITHVPAHRRGPSFSEEEEPFPVGCTVYVEGQQGRRGESDWGRGEVMHISNDGLYTIALESGIRMNQVPREHIYEYNPTTEGDAIEGCFEYGMEDCYPGTVTYVAPDGAVNIEFEDGDYVVRHPNDMIYAPPIKYIPPER